MTAEEVYERIVHAMAEALVDSDDGVHACLSCPHCNGLIVMYKRERCHADHNLPLCPEWVQYEENWEEPIKKEEPT